MSKGEKNSKVENKIIYIIAGIVLIAIIVVTLVFALQKDNNDNTIDNSINNQVDDSNDEKGELTEEEKVQKAIKIVEEALESKELLLDEEGNTTKLIVGYEGMYTDVEYTIAVRREDTRDIAYWYYVNNVTWEYTTAW